MRRTLGVIVAALGAVLSANVMAEYEFEGFTPWAAALAVGVLVGESVASGGRWRGRVAMVSCAALAGASLLWGEWLESDRGVEEWAHVAWGAAVLAALVAAWSVRPRARRGATADPG